MDTESLEDPDFSNYPFKIIHNFLIYDGAKFVGIFLCLLSSLTIDLHGYQLFGAFWTDNCGDQ